MNVLELYLPELLYGVLMLLWLFSTYRCVGSLLGFIHVISDATRLKIYEFDNPVAHGTLNQLGETEKIATMLPRLAFRMMIWSLVWICCLGASIGVLLFRG